MSDPIKKIQEERSRNMHDVFDNKIPNRVPIDVKLTQTVIADYSNIDRKDAYWNPSLLFETAEELCKMVPTDTCIFEPSVYSPMSSQALASINKVMSDTGYMQHPNTLCMHDDEYDELIEDPYAFLVDTCLPRIYKNLDFAANPGRALFALTQDAYLEQIYYEKVNDIIGKLNEQFGYPTDVGNQGFGRAPMDWISDQLRSFDGICMDIRRKREKILEAVDAVYPMFYKMSRCHDPNHVDRYTTTMFQLHMATYFREKDFAEVWLPSWRRLLTDYASLGMRCGAFLEHDWTRFLDYVYELPTGMYFTFESTDPKQIKEKLGKKFILGGGFPIAHLKTCTKSEVIAKTKEWLDIMAPGGQYIFGFDKVPITLGDVNIENLIAVCETVKEYGVYDNAGTATGEIFNKSDYSHSDVPEFESKYYQTWDDYLKKYPNTPEIAKDMVMAAEDNIFATIFYLSC